METNNNLKQTVLLEDRKKLVIDAVINVGSFNDDYLEISTNMGDITIEGRNLKIEELRHENGKILISGEISGLFYNEQKRTKGFFGNIFK